MPTRAEILDTLAASQTQVLAFFHGLSPQDLERPATASAVPGAAPWRAKDHFAHLVKSERNRQQLLRRVLAGEPRDVQLRLQYPEDMPLPGILGDWGALTPEEQERLELAVARVNQTYVNAHHDDTLEMISADYRACPCLTKRFRARGRRANHSLVHAGLPSLASVALNPNQAKRTQLQVSKMLRPKLSDQIPAGLSRRSKRRERT